uniref:Apolipoprotein B receptor n=1 Tax=Ictidomys tridecemlineatus TaxID=43179 RepID=A0A287D3F1_ICTTR
GETEARKTKDSEVEASGPSEADLTSRGGWRLEEAALGLQNQEDAQTSSLAPEIVALLPGPLLDVSAPRSRALLSRSSSQRRSRPSFRRVQASEEPEDPPSPQPEEGLSAPEQRPLQLEEAPEPSPPRPEGTPVPARRKTLGLGFGLAHPGMMQELQARLGRPKPQ